jgi:hypothetical protein
VKLRGRTEAPAPGAEGAQFLSARGAKQEAHHGPLQRLLDGKQTKDAVSLKCIANSRQLRTFSLWRFGHHPEAAIVTEWLNYQEGLSIDRKFAKIVAARELEAALTSHDLAPRNGGDDPLRSSAAKKETADAKAGKEARVISEVGDPHLPSNGEVEGPHRSARSWRRGRTIS